MVNLIKLCDISRNPEEVFLCLKNFKLIPNEKKCPTCNNLMEVRPHANSADGFAWRCRANYKPYPKSGYKQCDTLRSIRDGTFFGKFEEFGGGSNLTLFQVSCFILGF